MKAIALAAAAFALLSPAAVLAQTAPAAEPAAEAPAPLFGLDTPIEVLAADPRAKAVIDADLPGLFTHPSYEMFKGMSLRSVQPFSEGKITDELLVMTGDHLAAIKPVE